MSKTFVFTCMSCKLRTLLHSYLVAVIQPRVLCWVGAPDLAREVNFRVSAGGAQWRIIATTIAPLATGVRGEAGPTSLQVDKDSLSSLVTFLGGVVGGAGPIIADGLGVGGEGTPLKH